MIWMNEKEREDIRDGYYYVCGHCHTLFRIVITKYNNEFYCVSVPNETYVEEVYRPKAVCPKCHLESSELIRIESDEKPAFCVV